MRILLRLALVVVAILVVLWIIGTMTEPSKSAVPPPYPPRTIEQARALAATSNMTLHIMKRDNTDFPPCSCRVSALVPKGLSDRQTAAALLKSFFANHLDNFTRNGRTYDPGGTVLFGYYKPSEYGTGYTAGRVDLGLNNGKHTLTLDVGGDLGSKEYTINY